MCDNLLVVLEDKVVNLFQCVTSTERNTCNLIKLHVDRVGKEEYCYIVI